jgi:cobalt transporter subunit CbtA
MLKRVLAAALVAGFLAACVASLMQAALTTPLILQAETFEAKAAASGEPRLVLAHLVLAHAHGGADQGHADEEWKPAEGLSRMVFTSLATLVSGIGYALILSAAMLALSSRLDMARSLAFALAGFASLSLAPALGLPPELPGMGHEETLAARQAWWLATAVATALGLYLVALRRTAPAIALGIAIMVAPHLIGAPESPDATGGVGPVLAARFAARSLGIAFVFWITLGLALGWMWERSEASAEA